MRGCRLRSNRATPSQGGGASLSALKRGTSPNFSSLCDFSQSGILLIVY